MPINRIDVETGNYNLTAKTLVLTATPNPTDDKQCQVYIELGDGTDNLDGSGGIFELTLEIGGSGVQPAPQLYGFGISPKAIIKTNILVIPANQVVKAYIKSPNAADVNVFVRSYLFEIPLSDSIELILDPDEFRSIIQAAIEGLTVRNERVVLAPRESTQRQRVVIGPCEQPASVVNISRHGCGVVRINRR